MRLIIGVLSKIINFVPVAVPLNLYRDLAWAFITFKKIGLGTKGTAQFYAQWLYPSLAMLPFKRLHSDYCKRIVFNDPSYISTKGSIAFLSASVAIPVWNKAGELGLKIGEQIGLSSVKAGYFPLLLPDVRKALLKNW